MSKRAKIAIFFALTLSVILFLTIKKSWTSEEGRVIQIAKNEARKRGWKVCLVDGIRFEDGKWEVQLTRFPWALGGHASVGVSTNGEVLHYYRGK